MFCLLLKVKSHLKLPLPEFVTVTLASSKASLTSRKFSSRGLSFAPRLNAYKYVSAGKSEPSPFRTIYALFVVSAIGVALKSEPCFIGLLFRKSRFPDFSRVSAKASFLSACFPFLRSSSISAGVS